MANIAPQPRTTVGTVLGLLAILIWSTSLAFTRRIAEDFGTFDGMAISYFAGGLLGCVWLAAIGRLRHALAMPRTFHLVCGGLMVAYGTCYAIAVGQASDRQAVLEINIINYLWPGLTMLFALPILKRRATLLLIPGMLLALAGAMLSIAGGHGGGFSWEAFGHNLRSCSHAHLLALAGALCFGLYSNFNTRLAGNADGEAAPLHLMALGGGLVVTRLVMGIPANWHPVAASWVYLAATAIFPVLLAYMFWDIAMRRGHLNLVVSASYAAPLLSTVMAAPVLGVHLDVSIWLACALVIGGAWLCKIALRERLNCVRT